MRRRMNRALVACMAIPMMMTGQNVLDGVTVPERDESVTPYPYVREADMMWSKRVWRYVDLREKLNLPLAYPASNHPIKERQNLFDVIHDAVLEGAVTAYEAYDGLYTSDEFTLPIGREQLSVLGAGENDTIMVYYPEDDTERPKIISNPFDRSRVVMFKLKEDWYFDKKRSVMECRIIGIAPVIAEYSESGEFLGLRDFYWVYFPELRPVLAQKKVFIRNNAVMPLSFDDVFVKRMFSSFIIKESNAYDRYIKEYKTGMDALLEGESVKHDIMDFEQDLWEY